MTVAQARDVSLDAAGGVHIVSANVSRDLINRLERGSGRVEVAKVLDVLAALGLATVIEPRRSPVDVAAIVRAHEETP